MLQLVQVGQIGLGNKVLIEYICINNLNWQIYKTRQISRLQM